MSFDVSRSRLLVQYQIDSFTTDEFRGNPAGVVMGIRSTEWMQKMSMENNLGATAFIEPVLTSHEPRNVATYDIRWYSLSPHRLLLFLSLA
jgi:predicted PhzF superfamily epimerase YddE/YHI9